MTVASNDRTKSSTNYLQKLCAIPGKIEPFPKEIKQLTRREYYCQCPQARIQRNHIACA
ncbi:hypothetical protein AVDCRST_MAG84-6421 [uncultured Microcoleus sp.]|uniref:Uncharacterized protein n=1 Tax=uncultured Microcoleus sp. TaxID=259945 RepID=A0A6J4PDN3_9CYAN|nr:hypothetical protein AVDCRST_MAG84-6421 [uncultured Microcoleus sp.]